MKLPRRGPGATAPARRGRLRGGAVIAGGVILAGLGVAAARRRTTTQNGQHVLDLAAVGRTIGRVRLQRGMAALHHIAPGGAR